MKMLVNDILVNFALDDECLGCLCELIRRYEACRQAQKALCVAQAAWLEQLLHVQEHYPAALVRTTAIYSIGGRHG